MTNDERAAFENLILLCPNHHVVIDDLEPDSHTVDWLQRVKQQHEEAGAGTSWAKESILERIALMLLSDSDVDVAIKASVAKAPPIAEDRPSHNSGVSGAIEVLEAIDTLSEKLTELDSLGDRSFESAIHDAWYVDSLAQELRVIAASRIPELVGDTDAAALSPDNLDVMIVESAGIRRLLQALRHAKAVITA
ncbi:MAG: hypothetical protein QOJ29_1298 [Thermoleophilaceae bacterium]|jgi:hypothetical protein|nr:hypothetical protein [Thermoleophilaceae bacterium]